MFARFMIDQVARRIQQWHVQCYKFAVAQQIVQAFGPFYFRRQVPGCVHGYVRVVTHDLHAEPDCRIGDQPPYRTQADDAQRAPGQFDPRKLLLAVLRQLVAALASSPCRFSAKRIAGTRFRDAISKPASTSSFTAFAFAPGALNTGTPRRFMSFTGTLLVPAPARPIAFTLEGISICSMLCERTRIASGPADYRYPRHSGSEEKLQAQRRNLVERQYPEVLCARSGMVSRKFFHEFHQDLYPFDGHGVVYRSAHSANRTMPF